MIKVTIIIPVYNVENYIEECLESIINQSLKDIEIICVNDGSKDRSREIIEKYIEKDKRIKIVNKKNGGLASARNAGIEMANGEYIFFVDSDDFIDPKCIQKLYEKSIKHDLDVCICDIYKYKDKENKKYWGDLKVNSDFISSSDYLKDYFHKVGIPSVCNKLWKKSLYINNNIRHPENISYGEDGSTSPRLIFNAKRIGKVNEALYYYRVNPNSMMNTKNMKVYQYITAYNIAINYIIENGYLDKDNKLFNYKYNYAYKRLELISSFDNRLKEETDYKLLYNDFINDIKLKQNSINKPIVWNRETVRRYLIFKGYKINRLCGGSIKTIFVWMNNIVRYIRKDS